MSHTCNNDHTVKSSKLMTVIEAAELLRTTSKAIYSMVARGQLPGLVRIGRRLLFDREALLSWIDESRAPSPQER